MKRVSFVSAFRYTILHGKDWKFSESRKYRKARTAYPVYSEGGFQWYPITIRQDKTTGTWDINYHGWKRLFDRYYWWCEIEKAVKTL